jgi:hypothetical protein
MLAKAIIKDAEFDSAEEKLWSTICEAILWDYGMVVVRTVYHPFTLHLDGGKYTPDFLHILDDATQLVVEVKGSRKQRGYRDARTKLRAAAARFDYWRFAEVLVNARTMAANVEMIK